MIRTRIRSGLALVLALGFARGARAEGFTVHDLAPLGPEMEKALGPDYVHRAEANRITLTCLGCAGTPMVDVLLGRQDDGSEGRIRSGETSIDQLEARCREKNPDCRLSALAVAPAVGWISTWRMDGRPAVTVVILRDGDLLMIRSLADTEAETRVHADALVRVATDRIIGR